MISGKKKTRGNVGNKHKAVCPGSLFYGKYLVEQGIQRGTHTAMIFGHAQNDSSQEVSHTAVHCSSTTDLILKVREHDHHTSLFYGKYLVEQGNQRGTQTAMIFGHAQNEPSQEVSQALQCTHFPPFESTADNSINTSPACLTE